MRRFSSAVLVHGAVAGLIAGAVVAIWFLVVDLVTAAPFHTPLVLADAALGPDPGATPAQLVAGYTVLHFGVFAAVGVAIAWLLRAMDITPGVLAGIVVGIVVLEAVHYGALFLAGADVVAVLPAGHVLAANVLGGIVMMRYLHRALQAEAPFGPAILRHHETIARGIVTGLVGAAAVAVWAVLVDLWVVGLAFFTPASIGSALFLGADSPAVVRVGLGIVAAYAVLHVAAFCGLGIILDAVAGRLERRPGLWLVTLMAFIIVGGASLGIVSLFAAWVMGMLGIWTIGVGSLIAVVAMAAYLWRTHPTLRHRLLDRPVETRL
jgi:hypothetical protein